MIMSCPGRTKQMEIVEMKTKPDRDGCSRAGVLLEEDQRVCKTLANSVKKDIRKLLTSELDRTGKASSVSHRGLPCLSEIRSIHVSKHLNEKRERERERERERASAKAGVFAGLPGSCRCTALGSRLRVFARETRVSKDEKKGHRKGNRVHGFEAIATRLEAIASRLEAIATRLEAIAIGLEAIASRLVGWMPSLLGWRPLL